MQFLRCCLLISAGIGLCFGISVERKNVCGYDGCYLGDPSKLNVHIVSHTHNDLGYIKTVDQYYYGSRNNIAHAGVQYIIDSVVGALDVNPDRRFVYAEMAYFWRWWNQQTDDSRNKVRDLVNSGRLEFVSGGWCMSDEAGTHYSSIIDHHSLGIEFLNETFGECGRPKVGWQIAPFGHSREHASIQAQMGFDGLFFSRTDYRDYSARHDTKTMEMIWKASANLGRDAWLFAGLLPYQYGPPPSSLCFDSFCGDPPVMDNPQYHDYNVPERVQTFINAAQNEASMFATNHIMMTMGNDFQYENANEWFKNLDKLIKYVNGEQMNGSNVNVFYSTPSCYLYALNKLERNWTTKSDDFFPYAHHSHGFWTGYFTTRAALKGYERHSNNILQITRQLNAFSNSQLRDSIFVLSEAMGVIQHLDGISGTEKQEVAFDYAQRLSIGIDSAISVINQAYSKLLPKISGQQIPYQNLCQLNNISECLPIEDQAQFTVTLWNPTVHPIVYYFRVPVTKDYTVRDPTGSIILAEVIPISNATKIIPGRESKATGELIFTVSLPALGFNTYFFEAKTTEEKAKVKITKNDECILQNPYLRVEIDAQGNLQRIANLQKGFDITFSTQGFYWYQSYPGNNSQSQFQASGAYIFRPFTQTSQPVSTTRTITCIKAETVQTAIIAFNSWATQEIRLYDNGQSVEIEWTVGPVPIDDQIGKEIILRYDTDIKSQAKYYTDANGREVLERTRNSRPTWNYTGDEPVSSNYYPINSRIWIKEDNRQFTVLTDRSEGGASINDGSIEIMLHRRTLTDDSLGIFEPMNESAFGQGLVVRGKHVLIVEQPSSSALLHRVSAQRLYMHPLATFALPQQTYVNYSATYRQTWSALEGTLPLNVHLLTFDQLNAKNYRVRVEHYFELNEDANYSKPITFDLQSIFTTIGTINNIVELTLDANLPLANLERLNWTTTTDEQPSKCYFSKPMSFKDTTVTLNPMQIRTFQVTLAQSSGRYNFIDV